jgi:hypothetical protein
MFSVCPISFSSDWTLASRVEGNGRLATRRLILTRHPDLFSSYSRVPTKIEKQNVCVCVWHAHMHNAHTVWVLTVVVECLLTLPALTNTALFFHRLLCIRSTLLHWWQNISTGKVRPSFPVSFIHRHLQYFEVLLHYFLLYIVTSHYRFTLLSEVLLLL